MALKLKTTKSFALDYDDHTITGSVRVMSGADRLNYASQTEQARSEERIGDMLAGIDAKILETLATCDVEVDGSIFTDTEEKDRARYVEVLPIPIKQKAMHTALGMDEFSDSAAKNSESGGGQP